MALPAEPRQKMINLMYLVLTALLALNVSSEILNAFKVVDKSLMTSNNNLAMANGTLYSSLDDKEKDPQTAEKAKPWNDKAKVAKKLSADMIKYIDDLKLELKQEAKLQMVEKDGQQVEEFREDDLEAATRLFGSGKEGKKKGPELKDKLQKFRESMLAIDSSIAKEFKATFPVEDMNTAKITGQDGKEKDFTLAYFHMTPTVAALTLLSKFQNNIKNAENQVVTYCHNQVGAVKLVYDKFQAIASASSNYLMPGEEMIVTAGVGAFNDAAKPQISIDGASISLNENGVAEKKFNVSGGGKKSVRVNISFTKPDGTIEKLEKSIEYTVGTPGGAAVMLDKMNVFYIGVDNPVTIGSPTGWDKTSVTMTNGTITGSGSQRTVRVSTLGRATINVTADKKSYPFEFRVKRIPDPVFKVGPGGTRMPSVTFKNQQFCRAELENFDFDVKYNVINATVYFSGAGFPSVKQASLNSNNLSGIADLMRQCQPGSAITFDNVKVQGPDGTRTIQGVGVILY
jgi:gliding motility-associated protein GldM